MNAAYADPIEGVWKTHSPYNVNASIKQCRGAFCIVLRNGFYAGRRLGQVAAKGKGMYSGRIQDPDSGKIYRGEATLTGNILKLKGCTLGVFCRTEKWSRL